MNAKKISILKLLNNYPSFAQNDEAVSAGITAAMLETVAAIPADVVEEACQTLKRRHNSPFAPSGGQIYAECANILAKRVADRPKLSPPSRHAADSVSPERRAELAKMLRNCLRGVGN